MARYGARLAYSEMEMANLTVGVAGLGLEGLGLGLWMLRPRFMEA